MSPAKQSVWTQQILASWPSGVWPHSYPKRKKGNIKGTAHTSQASLVHPISRYSKNFPLPPRYVLRAFCMRACVCVFRYIDQILGLMDDDESGSGPGPGDLEMYERAVSFLSGNVEPTSDLDDVSLAYVQMPHLEMMEIMEGE
jgi:hypothetical protein